MAGIAEVQAHLAGAMLSVGTLLAELFGFSKRIDGIH